MIYIPVSVGELIDKLSILLIKQKNVSDTEKLKFINNEYKIIDELSQKFLENEEIKKLFEELIVINSNLWRIEDKLREMESEQRFQGEFIDYARKVYFTNDERFRLKNQINLITNSDIKEMKSYNKYN